jgi:heme/copper-type cytochrome/quinol oxidase subunit 2
VNIVDLLIVIIVVTILVTIALGAVTYLTYKLRAARRPAPEDRTTEGASWFFIRYSPGPRPPREN